MSDTKTVVSVTERATKAVTAAAGNLSKVVLELESLAQGSEQISQEIQFKQKELSQIDTQFAEKLAEAKSTLKIKTLENEDAVVNGILRARGLESIASTDLRQLRSDLSVAQDSNEDAITSAVAAEKASSARELASRLAAQESTHKIAVAEFSANEKAAATRIKDLEGQVADLRGDAKAERDARVETAKYTGGSNYQSQPTGKQ